VFQQLASLGRTRPLHCLLQAPFTLHKQMLAHIRKVAQAAAAQQPARIVVKINALTDVPLIEALIGAARAGAMVDLIVRGACMLPPGIEGLTDRIRVRSVVGRYLEHSRVIYFRWGAAAVAVAIAGAGAQDAAEQTSSAEVGEALFLSSADWMGRNMFGRIEVAWPVRDAVLRQRVIDECLVPYLHDQLDAWTLRADGSYERAAGSGTSAQQALMSHAAGTHSAERA
jgi:polyphosphate kinase